MSKLLGKIPLITTKPSIFSVLMLLILSIIIILSLTSGWHTLSSLKKIAVEEKIAALQSLADNKINTLNTYIDQHLIQIEVLSNMQTTQIATKAIIHAFHHQTQNPKVYKFVNTHYGKSFEHFLSSWGYYDLFIIDLQGNIVYTIKHEKDFATNLIHGPYKNTGLGFVFKQAKDFLQTSNSTFAYYPPSDAPGAFVATPIINDGVMLGVIALQFDTLAFYDELDDLVGIGQTGEIVTGQRSNQQILITAPLRHDANAAFKRTVPLHSEQPLPIEQASSGHNGSGIFYDWRGQEVIAVWEYIPALQWGMVVKVDTQEAFAFLHQVQRNYIMWVGVSLLFASLLIYIFTRRLTMPLHQLTKITTEIAHNPDLHLTQDTFHAPRTITAEVNALSQAFISMIHKVQASQRKLKDHVVSLANQNTALDYQVSEQTARMQAVIENAADGIITISETGVILSLNPAACTIFAYEEETLLGQPIQQLITAETLDFQVLQQNSESEGKRKSGEIFPLEISCADMYVFTQKLFLVTVRDITQAKYEREQLEHTQRLESLGVLAGGIAHDFNNILTAILGNAAIAKARTDALSPISPMLDNIEKSSERAAELCKQMLAYSGKGKFIIKHISLTEMVEEMLALLEVSIQKNIVMRLDLTQQLPYIEADVSQIQQIIMNLVINASEAIGKNSGTITVHTSVVHVSDDYIKTTYIHDDIQAGRYVTLEVSDTGCGMSKETQKRLFDPFFTTKFTGRGLGMSAILGIIRGHKGAIKVYSEEGKGSSFKLLFPCATSDKPTNAADIKPIIQHQHGIVLVIDDEESVREIASIMLEEAGYTVLTASGGVEGIAIFKAQQKDIIAILLDMTMPDMDGSTVFRELKIIQPDVTVILSSGYNEQDATNRFAGKGLAGFLQKPYTPDALYKKLSDVLK
ncbi:hybrid sensor histidine kinase/response regulator [Ghiorsea bivora]|uniref:hybrid sensor histidine kinase/response regulator n=1 Tax=Ghiorsea bivora TaxID=1485545 RepID=UPI0006914596|nr:response regulator [Ghiorsea bivora]